MWYEDEIRNARTEKEKLRLAREYEREYGLEDGELDYLVFEEE